MAKEELKWQNIDAVLKKSFDAMVEAEAAFKADFGKAAEERRSYAGGQVSGYEVACRIHETLSQDDRC